MTNKKMAPILVLVMIFALLLTACGGKTAAGGNTPKANVPDNAQEPAGDGQNSGGDDTQKPDLEPQPTAGETQVKITETAAKAMETELYETADFSVTIPKGWRVITGGANILHSIRIYDPAEPVNQMFILLKADCLLHSQAGKNGWQSIYDAGNASAGMMAAAPVLENPATENFFRIFPEYAAFAVSAEPTYAGYEFPTFDDFTVTERFPNTAGLSAYSFGDELLRAEFTAGEVQGEGLFSASVVDFGSFDIWDGTISNYVMGTTDGGYYMAYNIVAITAVKDTFIEWEEVLIRCMNSLEYSDSFVSATNQASNEQVALAMQISRNFNETMNGLMDSWERRNRSFDIMSQKQSDAILGYERVYNTDTNEIYKATNGFYDGYDGSTYMEVTDDNMYAQPISGYIERID